MTDVTLRTNFKKAFIRGLIVLLPTAVTLFILIKVYEFILQSIGNPITRLTEIVITELGIESLFVGIGLSETGEGGREVMHIPGLFGFVVAILLVYFVGFFFASFVGRRLLPMAERALLQIPIFKVIYPYARQVTDFFLVEKKAGFEFVVAVQYPRVGIYSLGFVTSEGLKTLSDQAGRQLVCVFIPSSPTPVTGYTVFVDPKEVILLDMTVDQVIRFVVSGGVLIPPDQVQRLKSRDIMGAFARERQPMPEPADGEEES